MSGGTVLVVASASAAMVDAKKVRTMAGNNGKSPAVLSRLFYPYLLPPRT